MPIDNLAEFIIYIVPGYIANKIIQGYFPAKKEDNFSQIANSIISALVIVVLINWIDEKFLNFFLHSNSIIFPDGRYTIALIAGGIFAGYIVVIFLNTKSWLGRKYKFFNWLIKMPDSIWSRVNDKSNQDWALVFLNDGTMYLGWISVYKSDPNLENQDFLLSHARKVDENLKVEYIVNGIGIYLNTRDVKRIEFIQGKV